VEHFLLDLKEKISFLTQFLEPFQSLQQKICTILLRNFVKIAQVSQGFFVVNAHPGFGKGARSVNIFDRLQFHLQVFG
jgi:hypothetical protein